MVRISYDGYLTEEKLKSIILKLFSNNDVKFEQNIKLPNLNKRWKFDIIISDLKLVIEFDGFRHFQDYPTIDRDMKKELILRENNWKVIRIPYFCQLTNEIVEFYFNKKIICNVSYPHGFICKKALKPHSFSPYGIARLKSFLDIIPNNVKRQIIDTMDEISRQILDMALNINLKTYYTDTI